MTDNDEFETFVEETLEMLESLDTQLFALKQEVMDGATRAPERYEQIFRVMHSLKGISGFFKLHSIEKIAHSIEHLLSILIEFKLPTTIEIIENLINATGTIKALFNHVAKTRHEPDTDITQCLTLIDEICCNIELDTPARPGEVKNTLKEVDLDSLDDLFDSLCIAPKRSDKTTKKESNEPTASPTTHTEPNTQDPQASTETKSEISEGSDNSMGSNQVSSTGQQASKKSIRVDTHVLDALLNDIGELVLTRNQVTCYADKEKNPHFLSISQALSRITSELQERIMITRMQPIGNTWKKIPRIVHDLSNTLGKQVQVVIEGASTELDRALLEALTEPITHIIRNAIDHGIETPDARVAAGKPPEGTLTLRAFHENGQINIEFTDDGKGIDVSAIRERALTSNKFSESQLNRMSQDEILDLIFLPSFSTKEEISNISGRGIGMDVVRVNVEKLGGRIELDSTLGQGSTIRIKLPLTLAIMESLGFICNHTYFSVPQLNIVEIIHVNPEKKQHKIEVINGALLLDMRGKLLPLIDLNGLLFNHPTPPEQLTSDIVIVMVLQAGDHLFAVIVDAIEDSQEIVVKPLSNTLNPSNLFSGSAILGDGSISIIIDVLGLTEYVDMASLMADERMQDQHAIVHSTTEGETCPCLLVDAPTGAHFGLPLDAIERFANISTQDVVASAGDFMLNYQNEIITLHFFNEEIRAHYLSGETTPTHFDIIFLKHNDVSLALCVGALLDIIDVDTSTHQKPATQPGRLFSCIIDGKITEIIDIAYLIANIHPLQEAS